MTMQQLSLTDLPLAAEQSATDGSELVEQGRGCTPDVRVDVESEFLCSRDRRILAFERQWFSNPGAKEAAITRQFGITPTRYFQILNGLLDDPRAMHESPQVVARLRRLRATRQRSRRRYRGVLRQIR
ncbi:MAG: DUF3263 domain-containing protein [Candidatus Nanopelagicales bacterium]